MFRARARRILTLGRSADFIQGSELVGGLLFRRGFSGLGLTRGHRFRERWGAMGWFWLLGSGESGVVVEEVAVAVAGDLLEVLTGVLVERGEGEGCEGGVVEGAGDGRMG